MSIHTALNKTYTVENFDFSRNKCNLASMCVCVCVCIISVDFFRASLKFTADIMDASSRGDI